MPLIGSKFKEKTQQFLSIEKHGCFLVAFLLALRYEIKREVFFFKLCFVGIFSLCGGKKPFNCLFLQEPFFSGCIGHRSTAELLQEMTNTELSSTPTLPSALAASPLSRFLPLFIQKESSTWSEIALLLNCLPT